MSKQLFFQEREEEYLAEQLIIEAEMYEKQREFIEEFVKPEDAGVLVWSSRKQKNRWKKFSINSHK